MAPYSTATTTFNTEQLAETCPKIAENITCSTQEDSNKSVLSSYKEFFGKLKWFNIVLLFGIHGIFAWGLFNYPYSESGKMIFFHYSLGLVGAIGICVGAHRLWTHRSYKAKLPLRILLMLCYCCAGHNPLFNWIRDHRVHHKFTDTDADPHNSKRGFFFSHVGWLLMKKHPEVTRRGKEIDLSDVLADPVIQFHQKYYIPLVLTFGFILPTIVPPLCWGQSWIWSFLSTFVGRYVLVLNMTWLVNSAAHMWGTKPYDKRISPTDNLFVSLVSIGEGWHNYHHTFPWDYKTGELGRYSNNYGTMIIDCFAKIGWAYDLKAASPELIRKTAIKTGDGSHPLWGNVDIPEMEEVELFQCSLDNNNNNNKKID